MIELDGCTHPTLQSYKFTNPQLAIPLNLIVNLDIIL